MRGIIVLNAYGLPVQSVRQAKRLSEEFDKLGVKTETVYTLWSEISFDGKGAKWEREKPDFAIFLDKDKYLSSSLTQLGIRVFNKHQAIRVCDDKGETYLALKNGGVNLPKTYFAPLCYKEDCEIDIERTKKIGKELGYPLIVKESFGSMGQGVYKADDEESLIKYATELKTKPHLFQEYLPYRFGTDVRVIVIGKKVVCAMERHNENDFRSNIAQGGSGRKTELTESFVSCAEKVATVLDLDYCGVDILYGKDGEPFVCEVNSNAFFEGIEKTTGINVAKTYARYIINSIKENTK